ncbi:hypothetical protein ES703_88610 [subsurface metagenome]
MGDNPVEAVYMRVLGHALEIPSVKRGVCEALPRIGRDIEAELSVYAERGWWGAARRRITIRDRVESMKAECAL